MVKVGIIGGGQLGMMTIEASSPEVPAHFTVLESSPDCPAKPFANQFIAGSLTSDSSIRELAASADVLTWEIEHINVDTLLQLQAQGKTIIPSPSVLTTIQNKGIQKQHYTQNNIPTAPYTIVNHTEITPTLLVQFPGEEIVVKTCTGGYDGKGVAILSKSQLLQNSPFHGSVLLEAKISPALEISIIVAVGQPNQNQHKETAVYPAIEMYFHPVSNLVEFLFSPARIHPSIEEKAKQVALHAVESLNSPGLFAVELFIVPQNPTTDTTPDFSSLTAANIDILVNEIAPRPHNSGHHTIEGCHCSQFEQFLRILTNKPLGNPALKQPAAMLNIVGPTDFSGTYKLEHHEYLNQRSDVFVHMYNKTESKPNRKLGHATILANNLEELLINAEELKSKLTIIPS
ncbi:MAG: hypothetical protein RLZZ252_150 [Bacteroidota bacterium]|jgi:5-(carboxyamino)imidazole ribonucleotide synthase